jgi:hypothetical protein
VHIAPALLSDMADVTRAIDAAMTPPRSSGRAACAAAAAAGAAPLPPARAGAPLPGRTRIGWWDRVRYMWRGRLRATLYRTELSLGAAPLAAHSLAATFTLLELDWAATHASLRANTLQLLARPPAHAQPVTSQASTSTTAAATAAVPPPPRLLLSLPAASAMLDVAWRTEDGGDAARHFLLDTQSGAAWRTLAGFRATGAALALRIAIRPRQPSAAIASAGGGRGAPTTPLGGGGGGGIPGGGIGGAAASPFASWSPNTDASGGAGAAPTLWLSPDEMRLLRAWAAAWRGAGAALRRGSARKRFGDGPRLPRERLCGLPSLVSSLSLSLEAARVGLAAPPASGSAAGASPDAASGLALGAACVTLSAAWERAAAAATEGSPVAPPPPLREVSMSLDVAALRVTLAEPPPPPPPLPEPPKEPRLVRPRPCLPACCLR